MALIRLKRGTRANLATAVTGNDLIQAEPYLITDEGVVAVGTSTNTFVQFGPGIFFVNHGATASVARPSGAVFVIWYGSVQPTNMTAPDVVIRTDEAT